MHRVPFTHCCSLKIISYEGHSAHKLWPINYDVRTFRKLLQEINFLKIAKKLIFETKFSKIPKNGHDDGFRYGLS